MAVPNQTKPFQKTPEVKTQPPATVKANETKVAEATINPVEAEVAVVVPTPDAVSEQIVAPVTQEQVIEAVAPAETTTKEQQKPAAEEPKAEVVVPPLAPAVVVKVPQAPAATDLEASIAFIRANGTVTANTAIVGMEQYIDKMAPGKPMDKVAGAANQVALWRTIKAVLEHSREDFNSTYSVMLGLWNKHKTGVFGERYVHRFMDMVNMDKDEVFAFLAILDLMRMTASPIGRKEALRQVDMNRALGREFSEQARQNILGFYGL